MAAQAGMPKLICQDCAAEFYLWNFGRYTSKQEEMIVLEQMPLYCFNHITQFAAIAAIGHNEYLNWN